MNILALCLYIVEQIEKSTLYKLDFNICYLDEFVIFSYKGIKHISFDFVCFNYPEQIIENIRTELNCDF